MSFDCHSKWRRADEPNGNWYYRKWDPHGSVESGISARNVAKRDQSCKSRYKMTCFSCCKPINRGDLITRVYAGGDEFMIMRYVGKNHVAFYRPQSGPNQWVHRNCQPVSFYANYFYPDGKYIGIWTGWSGYVESKWDESPKYLEMETNPHLFSDREAREMYDKWCEDNDYGKPIYMLDRIEEAAIKIQNWLRRILNKHSK